MSCPVIAVLQASGIRLTALAGLRYSPDCPRGGRRARGGRLRMEEKLGDVVKPDRYCRTGGIL
jgi:hypothetical protein